MQVGLKASVRFSEVSKSSTSAFKLAIPNANLVAGSSEILFVEAFLCFLSADVGLGCALKLHEVRGSLLLRRLSETDGAVEVGLDDLQHANDARESLLLALVG